MLERALAVDGFMRQSELELLHRLAASMPDGATVVEVGVWKGRSTLAIAEGLGAAFGGRLVAVDTFGGDPGWPLAPEPGEARAEFDRNTAGFSFLEVVQAESVAAAGRFEDGSVDWVFIDALHEYESVVADIAAWSPKVKPGGLISGHDYGRAGVTDAVLRVFGDPEVMHSIWMSREQPRLRATRVLKIRLRQLLGSGRREPE